MMGPRPGFWIRYCAVFPATAALVLIFQTLSTISFLITGYDEPPPPRANRGFIKLEARTIVDLQKMDDIKAVIYPKNLDAEVHSVTLGIGNDTAAEKRLKSRLPNAIFYGADPLEETAAIFRKLGKVYTVGYCIFTVATVIIFGRNRPEKRENQLVNIAKWEIPI
ncbi:unnamed protein product, partial [Mesorhabditis spiculigera]